MTCAPVCGGYVNVDTISLLRLCKTLLATAIEEVSIHSGKCPAPRTLCSCFIVNRLIGLIKCMSGGQIEAGTPSRIMNVNVVDQRASAPHRVSQFITSPASGANADV